MYEYFKETNFQDIVLVKTLNRFIDSETLIQRHTSYVTNFSFLLSVLMVDFVPNLLMAW